jgi:hypothetical protein
MTLGFFSRGVLRYFSQTWRNNSFRCLLRRLPRPQDVFHLCLRYCNCFNPFNNINCSARERAPWPRVTEKSHFSTLNVGLARTENWTQDTCLAGSVTRRSAIHYASNDSYLSNPIPLEAQDTPTSCHRGRYWPWAKESDWSWLIKSRVGAYSRLTHHLNTSKMTSCIYKLYIDTTTFYIY